MKGLVVSFHSAAIVRGDPGFSIACTSPLCAAHEHGAAAWAEIASHLGHAGRNAINVRDELSAQARCVTFTGGALLRCALGSCGNRHQRKGTQGGERHHRLLIPCGSTWHSNDPPTTFEAIPEQSKLSRQPSARQSVPRPYKSTKSSMTPIAISNVAPPKATDIITRSLRGAVWSK
jgi:hypothetical protein